MINEEERRLFGAILRAERIRAGLTQHQLARRAGLRDNDIGRWETGTNLPSLDRFTQLARVLPDLWARWWAASGGG